MSVVEKLHRYSVWAKRTTAKPKLRYLISNDSELCTNIIKVLQVNEVNIYLTQHNNSK
jgi:hypothetical protein